jgi:hypothetical protein
LGRVVWADNSDAIVDNYLYSYVSYP